MLPGERDLLEAETARRGPSSAHPGHRGGSLRYQGHVPKSAVVTVPVEVAEIEASILSEADRVPTRPFSDLRSEFDRLRGLLGFDVRSASGHEQVWEPTLVSEAARHETVDRASTASV